MKTLTANINCENVYLGGNRSSSLDIRESNVLGFIRRWYEALGFATKYFEHNSKNPYQDKCDISFKDVQLSTPENIIKKAENKLCLSCLLFGTTGWSKRFWIVVSKNGEKKKCYATINNRTFSYERFTGNIKIVLKFPSFDNINDKPLKESLEFLWFTLKFIEKYGYFGARCGKSYNDKGYITKLKITSNFGFSISNLTKINSKKNFSNVNFLLKEKFTLKLKDNSINNTTKRIIDWVK